jgi:hypothetical protein
MDQHQIATQNAIELYLIDPTRAAALEVITTLARWPYMERAIHAGKFLAALEALTEKHGELISGWRWRFGRWITRATVPEFKPTWNDYWLLWWTLTHRDRPDLAGNAIWELHMRAWHETDSGRRSPDWLLSQDYALKLVQRECREHPDFCKAMLAEIRNGPCRVHRELDFSVGAAS